MTDRIRKRGLAGILIALCLGAVLASATIVPPERAASVLRSKVGGEVTEDCKQSRQPAASPPAAANDTAEAKKSTETRHPRPDPIKHLLRGILL
jgi:hypothetical protein